MNDIQARDNNRFYSPHSWHIPLYPVPYGNFGCSGGNVYNTFMYVIANSGVDTENSYYYKGRVS